ncbi:MAG: hypothetical protein Fur0023_05020 [Bacteroidia bacterium]
MLKYLITYSVAVYYIFGSLILPCGNFSVLPELKNMYDHCKQTEDKDMNLLDFITDHLLCVDAIFDQHTNGDDQKPHSYNLHNNLPAIFYFTSHTIIQPALNFLTSKYYVSIPNYSFLKISTIFHPPAAC